MTRSSSPQITVTATPAYQAWASEAARSMGLDRASLIGAALAEYAKTHGLTPPPPRTK